MGTGLTSIIIAIVVIDWTRFARVIRAEAMTQGAMDYVASAQVTGHKRIGIMLLEILPNVLPPILVQATLTIATAIIAEASLSFLGLGQQAPAPSWGSMLNTAKNFLNLAPWMAMWPGISIFLVVLGFNLLGDGLRDALDPREH